MNLIPRFVMIGFLGAIEAGLSSPAQDPGARVVKFPGGQVTIEAREGEERIRVTNDSGALLSESVCPSELGTYDQLHSFFKTFKVAADSGDPKEVIALVRFPLRVNGTESRSVRSRRELRRQYEQVFVERVLKRIHDAEPAAVFCRHGYAMVGHGVIWVRGDKGRVAVNVVNQ